MPLAVLLALVLSLGLPGSPAAAGRQTRAAPGAASVLVVPVQWTGNALETAAGTDAPMVAAYAESWLESASRGRIAVTASARPATSIAAPSGSCDSGSIGAKVLAGLRASGVNPDAYGHVVAYFEGAAADACPFSGLTGAPILLAGRGSSTLWSLRNVVAHELIHMWGVSPHANALRCTDGGAPVAFSATCTESEQGDPFDIMGYAGYAGAPNAVEQDTLGWLAPSEVLRLTRRPGMAQTRTVTLAPMASPGSGALRAIDVAPAVPGAPSWSIELRTSVGVDTSMFDRYWTAATSQGVQVRQYRLGGFGPSSTRLIDTHPEGPSTGLGGAHVDASIGAGRTWSTPDGSLSVTESATVAADGSRAVTVVLREPPAAPTPPVATLSGEGQATVSWAAPADGGSPVTGYSVTPVRDGVPQAARSVGAVTSTTFAGLTLGSTYTFQVAATNALGSGPTSAASSPLVVPGPFRPFRSWDDFVARQLTDFAGGPGTVSSRAPDVAALTSGSVGPDRYISQRIDGPWYGGVVAPVSRLYWAYFTRTPDVAGVTYWAARRRAGASLDAVSQSFAGSAEFTRTYGALTNRRFVERVYLNVLGRPGEESGIAYWTAQLDQRKRNRGKVMTGFSESAEFKGRRQSDVATFMSYAGMLGRAPTATELASAKTAEREQIIATIRLSVAYAARVG